MLKQIVISLRGFVPAVLALTMLIAQATAAQSVTARDYANRAEAEAARGEWERAIADYDVALTLDSRNSVIWWQRGKAWLALKDPGLALRDFRHALKLAPDFAATWSDCGEALQRKGRMEKALASYNRALELNPGLADAYAGRGLCRLKEGKKDEAARDFERCVALNSRLKPGLDKRIRELDSSLTAQR